MSARPAARRTARAFLGSLSALAVAVALVTLPTAAAQAAPETRTWVGPDDGAWSVAANWSPAGAPQDGDTLVIDGWTINDLGPLALAALELRGGTVESSHTLSAGVVSTPTDSGESYLFSPVDLAGSTEFAIATGSTLALQGVVSGSGTLIKTGGSQLRMRAANSYTGATQIVGGAVSVEQEFALGASAEVTVANGAWLSIDGGHSIATPLTLAGGGFGGLGALIVDTASTLTGPIRLASDTTVAIGDGRLELTGPITAAGFRLTKRGAGTLALADETTGAARLHVAQGVFDLAGRTLDAPLSLAEDATLTGTGQLSALLDSPGDIELGPAGLDIASPTTFGSDLELVLAGSTPGAGYGTLRVAGDVVLQSTAGLLPVMGAGYDAPLGTVFTVLESTTGTITGAFGALPEGAVVPGVTSEALRVSYLGGAVTLTVIERSLVTLQVAPAAPEVGQSVTLTATVSSQDGAASPTGDVVFRSGGVVLGTATLDDGVATITTTFSTPGTYALAAEYLGSPTVAPSTSSTAFTSVGIPAPSISGPPTAQGYVGEPFEYRPTVVGDMGGPILALRGLPGWLTLDGATGVLTGTPDAPGSWVVILKPSGFIPPHEVTITVSPVGLVSLEVTPSAATVAQGGSVTLAVAGIDSLGRSVEVPAAEVVVTSSVATDVIDGLAVTFPTASPHTLTVRHEPSGAVGSVVVEVTPAAAPGGSGGTAGSGGLAATGSTIEGGVAAALLLVAGLALVVRRRPA